MKKYILYGMLFVLCNAGCIDFGEHVYRIRVHNNTTDTIQFYTNYAYPDTVIASERPRLLTTIRPLKGFFWDSKKKWEDVILPSDTVSIYFLSKDTVDKYGWDLVKRDHKILKRYDLSIYDLQKVNFNLPYPPTQEMHNMKMWPAYNEQRR